MGRPHQALPAGREHRPRAARRRPLAGGQEPRARLRCGRRDGRESLMESSLYEQGLAKRRQVVGSEYVDRVLDQVDDFDREWQRLLTEYCWGEVWGGEALGDRQRSLNNLCLLAATGRGQ